MKIKNPLVNKKTVNKALKEADKIGKDFEPIYRRLDWKWQDAHFPPSAWEISDTIKRMITELAESSKDCYIMTGGIEVTFCEGEDAGAIEISFRKNHFVYKVGK